MAARNAQWTAESLVPTAWKEVDLYDAQVAEGILAAWSQTHYTLFKIAVGSHLVWEIRDKNNRVLLSQYEFPGMPEGAPLSWATQELKYLKNRS